MKRRENMPALVYWALWGVQSRQGALGYLVASIVLCLAGMGLLWYTGDLELLLILIAPFWYGYAIRWVDRNGGWDTEPQ